MLSSNLLIILFIINVQKITIKVLIIAINENIFVPLISYPIKLNISNSSLNLIITLLYKVNSNKIKKLLPIIRREYRRSFNTWKYSFNKSFIPLFLFL